MYRHAAGQTIFAFCSMLLVLVPGFRPHAAAGGPAGAMGVVGVGVVEDPSRIPMISAGDVARLREHIGQRVIVVGVVKSAQWSASGKVMNIEFTEGEGQGLLAVVFENRGQRFNEAWGGDFPKAVTGKKVRLYGEVQEYGGYDEKWKGRPQMILGAPEQVTLPEGGADSPA
jgi:hypothetical protein